MTNQSSESVKLGIKETKRIVKELRREMPEIESISFSDSKEIFDWPNIGWPYAVIDIKAKEIEFQVAFKALVR